MLAGSEDAPRSRSWVRPYSQLDALHAHWAVSPDGRQFVFIKAESEAPDLILALNWPEELRRRTPR
jgi:outer membrane phospholipase A